MYKLYELCLFRLSWAICAEFTATVPSKLLAAPPLDLLPLTV